MNRFRIENKIFQKNPNFILGALKKIAISRNCIHLIINGISKKEMDDLNNYEEYNANFRIYNEEKVLDKELLNSSIVYISDVTEDALLENKVLYYYQQIDGYSGRFPFKNSITDINEKMELIVQGNKIGDLYNGIEYAQQQIENKYLGLQGFCYKCLNPLCDHSKYEYNQLVPNMISLEECEHKFKILQDIPMEVREVTKEQMIYILEVLTEIERNSDTCVDVVVNEFFKQKEKIGDE